VSQIRVLVVDDDPWILRMVSSSLEKKGTYSVDTARDGQQALRRVQAARPDMIITDVMMPVMDGWAFVQEIRADPMLADIPVLFLTALGKDEDRLHALGLKPDDYVSKPFRFDDLERRVLKALAKRGSSSHAEFGGAGHAQPRAAGGPARAPGFGPQAYGPPGFGPAAGPGAGMGPGGGMARPQPGRAPAARPAAAPFGHAPDPYADADEAVPGYVDPSGSGSFTGAMKRTGLSGRLEQLGLSSLLVMMEMERKDGVLQLQADDKRIGRIFLRRGQVIQARIDGDGSRDGRQSVYHMLTWQKGRFHFTAMDVDMEDLVQTSTTSLLMEGARLIDEANR
jgi:CheY-like chemotaxis protein